MRLSSPPARDVGDAPLLPERLDQIPPNQAVATDTAGAIARNDILRTSKRIGRTIW